MENRASPREPMLPIKDVLHNIRQKITSEVPEKTTSLIEEPKEVCSVCNWSAVCSSAAGRWDA